MSDQIKLSDTHAFASECSFPLPMISAINAVLTSANAFGPAGSGTTVSGVVTDDAKPWSDGIRFRSFMGKCVVDSNVKASTRKFRCNSRILRDGGVSKCPLIHRAQPTEIDGIAPGISQIRNGHGGDAHSVMTGRRIHDTAARLRQ